MSVTREEVKEWLRDWERDYVSLSEGSDAGHWDQRLACAREALAALDDAERIEWLSGDLLERQHLALSRWYEGSTWRDAIDSAMSIDAARAGGA